MAAQKQGDQLERTFSSYVRIQDVVLKTYLGRSTIGRSGERGSGISVLPARYDDDDNIKKNLFEFNVCKECIYTTPSHQIGCDMRSILLVYRLFNTQRLFFLKPVTIVRLNISLRPDYLAIARVRRIITMDISANCKQPSSRIWTQLAESISDYDNSYLSRLCKMGIYLTAYEGMYCLDLFLICQDN